VLLAIAGLFGPHRSRPAHEPEWPHGRDLCFIVLGTLALAIVAGQVFGVSLAVRYTAVVLPLFLLLAALGLRSIPPAARAVVLGLAVTCGLAGSLANVGMRRTQAGDMARVLKSRAGPGDMVVYCPDQLGPGVNRLMPARVRQLTFPDFAAPERVDWVDYARRNRARDPAAFAQAVDRRAGAGRVWLVYSGRYRVVGTQCARLTRDLAALRPPQKIVLRPDRSAYEHGWLLLYEPAGG
jgi:mannosyltransferase